jgi:hypothetical protein
MTDASQQHERGIHAVHPGTDGAGVRKVRFRAGRVVMTGRRWARTARLGEDGGHDFGCR